MERTLNVDIYNNYILYNKNNRFIQNDMKTCFLKLNFLEDYSRIDWSDKNMTVNFIRPDGTIVPYEKLGLSSSILVEIPQNAIWQVGTVGVEIAIRQADTHVLTVNRRVLLNVAISADESGGDIIPPAEKESSINKLISDLNTATVSGENAKQNLDISTQNAETSKTNLDNSISIASTKKQDLDTANNLATQNKSDLDTKNDLATQNIQTIQDNIDAYNQNAVDKTNIFNQNSINKTNDFNINSTDKTGAFNTNYTTKLEAITSEGDAQVARLSSGGYVEVTDIDTELVLQASYYEGIDSQGTQFSVRVGSTLEIPENSPIKDVAGYVRLQGVSLPCKLAIRNYPMLTDNTAGPVLLEIESNFVNAGDTEADKRLNMK